MNQYGELQIKPDPDFGRLEIVLRRGVPDRVPFYEIFSNIEAQVLCVLGKYQPAPGSLSDLDRLGMKVITNVPGIFENVMWLLGYEGTCYLLYDDEPLFRDMLDAVGSRIVEYFEVVASFEVVGAMRYGDDMGFKTQTLLAPSVFRKYLFPWHRKVVETAHRYGKPVILHACGNLKEIMEDIIATGWDAKHSFEDVIEPIWEARQKYGERIALLGGFDVDKLSRMSEEEVRAHTRYLIETCAPGGGWALGSGNSIPEYIPVRNLLAMLEEGFCCGKYQIN